MKQLFFWWVFGQHFAGNAISGQWICLDLGGSSVAAIVNFVEDLTSFKSPPADQTCGPL